MYVHLSGPGFGAILRGMSSLTPPVRSLTPPVPEPAMPGIIRICAVALAVALPCPAWAKPVYSGLGAAVGAVGMVFLVLNLAG